MLCVMCILLPVSNSYLTDSHCEWSTLPFILTLQLTPLPHSISLSTKPRVNSSKSTPTHSSTQCTLQPFNPFNANNKTPSPPFHIFLSSSLLSTTLNTISTKRMIQENAIRKRSKWSLQLSPFSLHFDSSNHLHSIFLSSTPFNATHSLLFHPLPSHASS